MATSAVRIRLPSINELASSNAINLSPRFKDEASAPGASTATTPAAPAIPALGYKYPAKPAAASSNYVFSNPTYAAPVTPAFGSKQSPQIMHTPQPSIVQHHSPSHIHHLAPPPPAQLHFIPPTPPATHQVQPQLQQHNPQPVVQQYHSPPTHFQSPPPQFPQYAPAFTHQVAPPPMQPITQQRHQGYYQPIYYQQAHAVAGTQYTVPEVINKPNNKCHRCGTTETPEWRRGPNGVRTLCNACGLFHAKLVKRKGAALAAEEVLNNKVCKGKNGRRISIKKHNSELLKNDMKLPMHHQGLPAINAPFGMQPPMIHQ